MQIIYKVRVRENFVDKFSALVRDTLIPEAYKLSSCELFSVYQNTTEEREFIFHEIWNDKESIIIYKKSLIDILGNPHSGEEFPARMNDMIYSDEDLL